MSKKSYIEEDYQEQEVITGSGGRTRIIVEETVDGSPAGTAVLGGVQEKGKKRAKAVNPPDRHIWGIYILLLIVSILELYSASSREVSGSNVYLPLLRHGRFLILGFGLVLVLQRTHYKYFRKVAWPVAAISLVLLVYASNWGLYINGAQRALSLGPLGTFQPAEFVKLTCMLLLAAILAKHQMKGGVTNMGIILSAAVVVAFGAAAYKNGLTNTAIIMGVSLCMFIIGGISWSKIGLVILVYALSAGCFKALQDNNSKVDQSLEVSTQTEQVMEESQEVDRTELREGRISAWLKGVHPTDTIKDGNRQAMLARFSQANGGLVGQGLGNSRETARLPLAFSDYIYSIIVEETGFVGGIILMCVYLLLLARAGWIVTRCSRAFPALLIMGCAVLIVFQALVHMGIVTGAFPESGQPLPLISKGGTSVLVMSIAFGMMLSVSRFAVRTDNKKAIKEEMNELPEDLHTENPSQIK